MAAKQSKANGYKVARLQTLDGQDEVGDVLVPADLPYVLLWGIRAFVLHRRGRSGHPALYREASWWQVHDTAFMP